MITDCSQKMKRTEKVNLRSIIPINYHTFDEHSVTDVNSLPNSFKKSFKIRLDDLPPEILHQILSFYAHTFRDLIKFCTINRQCRAISENSEVWLRCNLNFTLPARFLPIFSLHEYSQFFYLGNEPEDVYQLPYKGEFYVTQAEESAYRLTYGTAPKPHEFASFQRTRFMKLFRAMHQQSTRRLSYYQKGQFYLSWCRWNDEAFIYWTALEIFLLIPCMYFLYDFHITRHPFSLPFEQRIYYHLGAWIIFYSLVIYAIRFTFMAIAPVANYYVNSPSLKLNVQWRHLPGLSSILASFINLCFVSGLLLSAMLVYCKCLYEESIPQWVITTIPNTIFSCLALFLNFYRTMLAISIPAADVLHLLPSPDVLNVITEGVVYFYLFLCIDLVPFLFALYYDDPIHHAGITNPGLIIILFFPLFLFMSVLTILLANYYFHALIFTRCISCESLSNETTVTWRGNWFAIGVLVLAIVLTIIMNYAIVGFCLSCWWMDNAEWDRVILNGLHFSPLLYAILIVITATSLILVTFAIQDYTTVLER